MILKFSNTEEKRFAEVTDEGIVIHTERDVLDLMADCGEVRSVLIHHKNVAPNFFDLSSGLAGTILQKFATYYMKGALMINRDEIKSKYFSDLMNEHSRSSFFRFFEDRQKAVDWLVS